MRTLIKLLILLFIPTGAAAQVSQPPKFRKPAVKIQPEILNPSVSTSLKIIASGDLKADHGATWGFAATTLPDGKMMVAWSNNYSKGEAQLYSPTMTPHTATVYTKNNYRGGSVFFTQEALAFDNGNVLLVYIERYPLSQSDFGYRLAYVILNKNGQIVRNPTVLSGFTPKTDESLVSLNVASNPGNSRAYVFFTENYRQPVSGGVNDCVDTYLFVTDQSGRIAKPVKKVLAGYNAFSPRSISVSKDPIGGLFLGHKSRDLFVEYFLDPLSPESVWKVQATRNRYDLDLVGIHGVSNRKALMLYTEGKTGIGNTNRLAYRIVGKDAVSKKIVISESEVDGRLVESISLKNRSVFVVIPEMIDRTYRATAILLSEDGTILKEPFTIIEEFQYHAATFDITEMYNGQVLVIYQDINNKPRYIVVN